MTEVDLHCAANHRNQKNVSKIPPWIMRWLEGQRIQYSDMREDRFQRRRKQEIRESEGGSESQNYVSDIYIYIYIYIYIFPSILACTPYICQLGSGVWHIRSHHQAFCLKNYLMKHVYSSFYGSLRWEVREICIVSCGCSEGPLQMAT